MIPNTLQTHIPPSHSTTTLALEHGRPRRSVRLLSTVQVVRNPRVGALVRARQTDSGRSLARTAGDDIDLGTLHVELRAGVAASRVQRDQLTTEQVLARSNASGDGDGLLALVGDQAVDAPFCPIEGVLGDLNTLVSRTHGRVVDASALSRRTLNHPLPMPESVFASVTFFMYAITGPLWLASMTSLGPEVSVWRHVRVA